MKKPFFIFFNFLILIAQAQRPNGGMPDTAMLNRMPKTGKISGIIIDSLNKKGVDYASVALLRSMDSAVIAGAVTNTRGTFTMENLPMGRYLLVVTAVGYRKQFSKTISIFPREPEVDAGSILVAPTSHQIKEVEITADKQAQLNTIDKRVIDVSKSIVNVGGTATEVLQNVPGVTVDIDGNVSLRGNANVIVLIDGKPSAITGSSRAAILQQMPAGSIEKIEIITNPGAKYDADGMAGIINIITKKDKMQGFNVNAAIGSGTHDKYNASLGINYRVKKVNLYSNYNYRSEARTGDGHSERRNDYSNNGNDTVYFNNNISKSINYSSSHVLKLGTDFYIKPTTTLGLSATLNLRSERSNGDINYIFENALKEAYAKLYRTTDSKDANIAVDYSFDFKHILKKKQEFTASATLSTSSRDNKSSYLNYTKNIFNNTLGNLFLDQYNKTAANFNVLTAQADFSQPLKGNQKFETGLKTTNRYIINNYDAFNFDTANHIYQNDSFFTQHFDYEEHIQAAYLQYSGIYKSISYQLGMRGEIATISGKSLTTNIPFNFQYLGLYPSALAKYTYHKTNDLQVSYSRRVNRPDVRSLLPIKNYEDAYNFMIGNPELKPESINSFEFSYYKTLKQHSFGTTLYYRRTLNMNTRLRTLDTLTGVATTTFRNYSTSDNTGLEIIVKNTIKKAIQITTNINLFQNTINGTNIDANLQSTAFNWNVRTNIAGRLSKKLSLQLSGMYMAPTKMPQSTFKGMSGMDLGGKYDFWASKASLTINLSDVLNSRHFELYNFGAGFTADNYRKRETRILMATFSYRFGNNDQPQRKKDRMRDSGGDSRMDDF